MSVFLQRNFWEEEEGVVAAAAEGKEVLQAGNFTGDGISFFLSFYWMMQLQRWIDCGDGA
jgi:hypothetical protein